MVRATSSPLSISHGTGHHAGVAPVEEVGREVVEEVLLERRDEGEEAVGDGRDGDAEQGREHQGGQVGLGPDDARRVRSAWCAGSARSRQSPGLPPRASEGPRSRRGREGWHQDSPAPGPGVDDPSGPDAAPQGGAAS